MLIAVFSLYAAASSFIYFQYVEPWIAGRTELRIGADSDRYWDAVKAYETGEQKSLVTLEGNFLGPVLIGVVFQNGVGVMCFNIGLFILSMKIAGSIPGVNKTVFGCLMLLNVELLPDLVTLNKEILALFAAILTAKYLCSQDRSWFLLGVTLLVSFLERWEQAFIFLLLLMVMHSPLRNRPKLTLALLILLMSAGYPLAFRAFHIDPHTFDWLLQDANTILLLNRVQDAGGFFLVVGPKIFMTIAGRLATPWFYWSGEFLKGGFRDPQQDIFRPLGSLVFVIAVIYALWRRKLRLKEPVTMLIALTMIITAVAPFIQPRYLYPAYVLLCLEISRSGDIADTAPTPG